MIVIQHILVWAALLLILSVYFVPVSGKKHGSVSRSSGQIKGYNLAKKRILSELREIKGLGLLLDQPFNSTKEECGIRLSPMKNNILEWHFSFTGVEGSNYEGGVYHGRIILHPEYPRKAPVISMSTSSGRWDVNKAICLSASAHHQETWDTSWNLRTLVLSLRGFIITQPREIGGILTPADQQKKLAIVSRSYACYSCGVHHDHLLSNARSNTRTRMRALTSQDEALLNKVLSTRKTRGTSPATSMATVSRLQNQKRESAKLQVSSKVRLVVRACSYLALALFTLLTAFQFERQQPSINFNIN